MSDLLEFKGVVGSAHSVYPTHDDISIGSLLTITTHRPESSIPIKMFGVITKIVDEGCRPPGSSIYNSRYKFVVLWASGVIGIFNMHCIIGINLHLIEK